MRLRCPVVDRVAEPLRHHGDVDAAPGLLDFAVNVRGGAPPPWLQAELVAALGELGRYPTAAADVAARTAVAARHGRDPEQVLLLSGAAEGFALLPRLAPCLAAVVHPSFTEPEFALREAGVPVVRVVLAEPYELDPALVPAEADLVVLGNPTNPTSVLHPASTLQALRRPGRLVVIDEAFMDAVVDEPESLASHDLPDVLVLRSLTKTFALAGLRAGYALGAPDVLARLAHGRPHWPLGTLQLKAVHACSEPAALAWSRQQALLIAAERTHMEQALAVPAGARAPFLLVRVRDGPGVRNQLRRNGIAVRRCDTFPGLGPDHLRLAVRDARSVQALLAAWPT